MKPATHVQLRTEELPDKLTVLGGQVTMVSGLVHAKLAGHVGHVVVRPLTLEYEPSMHEVQFAEDTRPMRLLKVPAGQWSH